MTESRKLGDYDLIHTLGVSRGAFGLVHKGQHRHIPSAPVAIKEFKKLRKNREDEFFREIEALEVLLKCSPHLVVFKYASFDSLSKSFYCVMEWCEGGDLAEISAKNQGLSSSNVLKIGYQVCEGLKAAHELGFVHRDIKPKNLMLGEIEPDGYQKGEKKDVGVKIIDFGLADFMEEIDDSGTFHGTPLFASPEQIRSEEELPDQRSDLYSLGLSLWFLCLGRRPKVFEDNGNILLTHISPEPHDLSEIECPHLRTIVARLVQKKREDRYQNAEDAIKAFELALGIYLQNYNELPDLGDLVVKASEQREAPAERIIDPVVQRKESLEDRYTSVRGAGWGTDLGKVYEATINENEEISLLLLDEGLISQEFDEELNRHLRNSAKWMVDSLVWAMEQAIPYPDSLIRPRALHWFSHGETIIESDSVSGMSLREIVHLKGRQSFADGLPLVAPIGRAVDFCSHFNGGCGVVALDPSQIFLSFEDEISEPELKKKPLSDWPEYRVRVSPFGGLPDWMITKKLADAINFHKEIGKDDLVEMTMTDTLCQSDLFAPQRSQSALFAALIFWLMSGRSVGIAAFSTVDGFSNVRGISEESNQIMREVIAGTDSCETSGNCVDFLKAVCKMERVSSSLIDRML